MASSRTRCAPRGIYEGGWKPRQPQRHLVENTRAADWSDQEAEAVSDVVLILKGETGWAIQFVARRYHDTLHRDDGTWKFHRRSVSA